MRRERVRWVKRKKRSGRKKSVRIGDRGMLGKGVGGVGRLKESLDED